MKQFKKTKFLEIFILTMLIWISFGTAWFVSKDAISHVFTTLLVLGYILFFLSFFVLINKN